MFLDISFTITVIVFIIIMFTYFIKHHIFPWHWLLSAVVGFFILATFVILSHANLAQENPVETMAVIGLSYFIGYEIIGGIKSAVKKLITVSDNEEQSPPPTLPQKPTHRQMLFLLYHNLNKMVVI